MELIIIFATLALIGASIAFIGYRAATEVERTIRLAIEKGVLTNASLIPELREPAGLSWVERLTLLGMLILFASGGIVLVAIVLIVSGAGMPTPLFALSTFAASLGAGLIYCGRWLRRTRERT
jgi:hypothetical protein